MPARAGLSFVDLASIQGLNIVAELFAVSGLAATASLLGELTMLPPIS